MPDVYSAEPKSPKEDLPRLPSYTDPVQRRAVIMDILRRVGEVPRSVAGGAYVVCPERTFLNAQEDEEVVLLLRAHPITNIGWIVLTLFLVLFPSLLLLTGAFSFVPTGIVFFVQLAWYLVTLGFAFEKFLYWYYSIVVVTNERIVDIDFYNLLRREVVPVNLNHIEQAVASSGGLFRSLFNFGDVTISSASEQQSVEALATPLPDKVVAIISELQEELEKRRERGQ